METLVAVLIYLGMVQSGACPDCYTTEEIEYIEDQNQEQVDAVYADEKELNTAKDLHLDEVPITWEPDDDEIAY